MSEANKIKNPSDDKISKAIGKMIRTSPIKLNDAIKNIRGKKVGDALSHLEFSKKRISNEAKKILESAIANAERFGVSTETINEGCVHYYFATALFF